MSAHVYDAGALIAAEHNQRRVNGVHDLALAAGARVMVPKPVLAQVRRHGSRQVRLARFVQTCEVVPLDEGPAKNAGVILGRASRSDVVDEAELPGPALIRV